VYKGLRQRATRRFKTFWPYNTEIDEEIRTDAIFAKILEAPTS